MNFWELPGNTNYNFNLANKKQPKKQPKEQPNKHNYEKLKENKFNTSYSQTKNESKQFKFKKIKIIQPHQKKWKANHQLILKRN